MIHWYQWLLFAVCGFAALQSSEPIRRMAAVLLANALAVTIVKLATGHEIVAANILIDGVSAYLIMRDPANSMQGVFGYLFAMQVGSHLSYILNPLHEVAYWQVLNLVFLAQLVTLAFWSAWHGGQMVGIIDWAGGWISDRLPRFKIGGAP
jgi:thiosulfate reductase cytochrome b subunit